MCIAINSPKGTEPTKKALKESFNNNPHGGGFAYAKDGFIIVKKGYELFKDFYEDYKKANIQNINKLIHFRIKTSGKINYENCHPFYVTTNLVMIHNGIISNFGNSEVSDTREFISMVLKPIILKHGINILNNETFVNTVSEIIGNSKLVFLDNKGNTYYINKDLGHKNKGIWYSNDSYMSYTKYTINNQFDYLGINDSFCGDCGQIIDKSVDGKYCEYCTEYEPKYKGFHFS